jgi:hypothetical protein
MADFYESFLQFAVRFKRDGEREVRERRERREERGFFFFFFFNIHKDCYGKTLYLKFHRNI